MRTGKKEEEKMDKEDKKLLKWSVAQGKEYYGKKKYKEMLKAEYRRLKEQARQDKSIQKKQEKKQQQTEKERRKQVDKRAGTRYLTYWQKLKLNSYASWKDPQEIMRIEREWNEEGKRKKKIKRSYLYLFLQILLVIM